MGGHYRGLMSLNIHISNHDHKSPKSKYTPLQSVNSHLYKLSFQYCTSAGNACTQTLGVSLSVPCNKRIFKKEKPTKYKRVVALIMSWM